MSGGVAGAHVTTREGDFPPLVTSVADEGGFTSVSFATSSILFMPADFRSKDVARGFTGHPLTPGRGLNSMLPADT